MDTDRFQAKIFIERLRQAVRVLENLSESDRANFDVEIWAATRANGVAACVAGHCGLDAWFQAEGLHTTVGGSDLRETGSVYPHPIEFFGTEVGFYRHTYGRKFGGQSITVDDAIAAVYCAMNMMAARIEGEPAAV